MTVSIIGEYLYPLLLPIVLWLFAISLWTYYNNSLKDRSSSCPLPPGNYGLPFVGETLHMVFQVIQSKSSQATKKLLTFSKSCYIQR